ncbi:MAG TPA: flagellar FlbD family protein [Euzebyales bacterium]|nr:flagellar FlbD family protein [Euzebyales bacterium]
MHRLRGEPLFVNADFVESIESTPDTVLTLLDGRRLIVSDSAEDVVEAIREFRASVLVATERLRDGGVNHLRLVTMDEE